MRILPIAFIFMVMIVLLGCGSDYEISDVHCRASAEANQLDRWQTHLAREAADGFSGAVLIADSQQVIFSKEYGDATKDTIPTAFWIGSISKPITATAVLRLVEEEKLSLHDPISTYLPNVPDRWADINLLSHRSGLPHAYAADGIQQRSDALQAILALPKENELGTYSYSNDGYSLLAILIEDASGVSFESYIQHVVFDPAGMKHAGFWGFEPKPSTVAPPNNPERAEEMPNTIWKDGRSVPNWGYRGASGMYATPEDLFRFVKALRNGRLLEPETFSMMISPKDSSIAPDATTRGYGWAIKLRDGHTVEFLHGGSESWLEHNGILRVDGDRIYITLTNSGRIGSLSWARRIDAGLLACVDD